MLWDAPRPDAGRIALAKQVPNLVHRRVGVCQQEGGDPQPVKCLVGQGAVGISLPGAAEQVDRPLGLVPAQGNLGFADIEHCHELAGRQEVERTVVDCQPAIGEEDRWRPDDAQRPDDIAWAIEQV